jgi:hypothetical protein
VASLERVLDETAERLAAAKQALFAAQTPSEDLIMRARALERELDGIQRVLYGDASVSDRFEPTPPSLRDRMNRASVSFYTTSAPTRTQQEQYQIAMDLFTAQRVRVERLANRDVPALERDMERLGVAWTPGRRVPDIKQ